jgi:hypothetical protein
MYFIGGIMENETVKEFRQKLQRSIDNLINFQPPKPTRQTRAKTHSKKARDMSGWKRAANVRVLDRINAKQ